MCTLVAEAYVVIKVRMRLDWSMITIAVAYLLSFFFRTPIFPETELNLVHAFASMVIWGIMYFFVFEMKRLQDTLTSQTLKDNLAKAKKTSFYRWLVFSVFLLVIVSSANALYLTKMTSNDTYLQYQTMFDIVLIVRGISKILIDIYMFSQFYSTFFFFVTIKKQVLIKAYGPKVELTPFNQLIIYVTMLLWALNILFSLTVSVVWGLFQSSIVQNSPDLKANSYFRIILQPVTWIIYFMTLIGLLYLFHYQGVRILKKEKDNQESDGALLSLAAKAPIFNENAPHVSAINTPALGSYESDNSALDSDNTLNVTAGCS